MPRVFVSVVDQIQSLRLAWREYCPDAVISGMTLAEFEAATAEPLATRQEIDRLIIQLNRLWLRKRRCPCCVEYA
jgi:hypothetical protein